MKIDCLTPEERLKLLKLARRSMELAVCSSAGQPGGPPIDLDNLPPALLEQGVCFVTLTLPGGELRGCIGALEASQSLAADVCEHAAAAALDDYRFQPVTPEELPLIQIEISRLTPPQPLDYQNPEDLPNLIRPHEDGVVLRDGFRRATFLPQVWEKIPDPCQFLSHLCQKMGAASDLWQRRILQVEIYHVEEFRES
jgi:AmmeMemoRadiSam system protein A